MTTYTGAMIALVPTEADAVRLALPGGESAEQLHLTLWFLGEADQFPDGTYGELIGAIRSMIERRALPEIHARAFGADLWNPDTDTPAWVLQVGDLPDDERPDGQDPLGAFRHEMNEAWHDGMMHLDVPPQHSPWSPHICLAYSDDPDLVGPVRDRIGNVVFDRVRVAFAGEYVDILLGTAANAPTALPGEQVPGPSNLTVPAVCDAPVEVPEDKFDPSQPRRSDGTWGDGPALADDKLGLAKRIQLEPGEALLGSREVSVNGSSSSAPVLAAVQTGSGVEIRFGIVAGEDTQRWGAANKGGTAKFDASAAANLDSVLETEADNARRHQKALHDMWDDVDDAQDDLDELRSEGAGVDEIEAAQERLDSVTEAAQATDIDSQLAEGVIPGSDWADIVYQVWGSDDPKAPYTVHLVVKPHDAGDDWTWDDATSGGEDARLGPADLRKLRRDLKALTALGGSDQPTNLADQVLPVRFFTDPISREGARVGARTEGRAARTRMRAESKRKWFRIQNTSAGTDIYLYGEIGCWGVTASDFTEELRSVTSPTIELHINSPGGDVFEGVAIYEALDNHPAEVNVSIDGLAASAASFVAMVGKRIKIAEFGQMMIHEAASGIYGTGKRLRKHADTLDKTTEIIARAYAKRAGGDPSVWLALMEEETWFDSAEAVQFGLADEISGSSVEKDADAAAPVRAVWDLSVFAYAGRDAAPAPALVSMALATEPSNTADGGDEGDEPAGAEEVVPAPETADETPESADAEGADPAIDTDTASTEPAAVEPLAVAPIATPATPEPTATLPLAWATPAWLDTPADPWQSLVAGFTNPEPSTADDQLAAPLEATK